MELLLQQFSKNETNEEFLERMTADAGNTGKQRPKPVRSGK